MPNCGAECNHDMHIRGIQVYIELQKSETVFKHYTHGNGELVFALSILQSYRHYVLQVGLLQLPEILVLYPCSSHTQKLVPVWVKRRSVNCSVMLIWFVFGVAVHPVSRSAHRLDEFRSRLESGQVRLDVRVVVDDATAFDSRRPHDAVADHDVDSCQPAPQ